jgi:hypothetical protein
MSTTATANGAQTVTAFLSGYGSGGDSTTVGVMDCRGRMIAGRDPSSTVLSSATALNSPQGSQSQTLTLAQLPTGITSANASQPIFINLGVNIPYTIISAVIGQVAALSSGATNIAPTTNGNWGSLSSISANNSISVTSNNTLGNAHPIVPPIVTAECVVVVLP